MSNSTEIAIDAKKSKQALSLVYSHLSAISTCWLILFALPNKASGYLILSSIACAFAVIWLFFFLFIAPWLCKAQAARLRYWLENNALHANGGLFFYKKTSIPVSRITDITLSQGPLQRIFGVWLVKVQTAGTGQKNPEVVLFGVEDPEQTKVTILAYVNAAITSTMPNN